MPIESHNGTEATPAQSSGLSVAPSRRRFSTAELPATLRDRLDAPLRYDLATVAPLWDAWQHDRSDANRRRLVDHYLPLVAINVRQMTRAYSYFYTGAFEDMLSDGLIGLLEAIDRANDPAAFLA